MESGSGGELDELSHTLDLAIVNKVDIEKKICIQKVFKNYRKSRTLLWRAGRPDSEAGVNWMS